MIRPATLPDVVRVAERMWARGREELTYLGIHPEEWIKAWASRIQRGNAISICDVAILGWDIEGDICTTSFQATEDFERHGKAATKALRKAIPELMRARKIRVASIYSLCVDPGAPKWFRLLGFHEDESYRGVMRGPYLSRRFVRRA